MLVLVVLPYLLMFDYLLPAEPAAVEAWAGPKDVYTLANYVTLFDQHDPFPDIFLPDDLGQRARHGALASSSATRSPSTWPRWRGRRTLPLLLLLLLIPFWVNEILRTFAWFIILAYQGPLNAALMGSA